MKKIYLLLLLCLSGVASYAQTAASYYFSRSTGTYNSIVGGVGTVAVTGGMLSDDGGTTGIPIGFTFNFCGTDYTTCAGDANGVLSLSNNGATYIITPSNISGPGFLMPMWADDNGNTGSGGAPAAYYQTTGAVGSRVFTLEWNDWSVCCISPYHMNWQVKLYEGTNQVQFCYGSNAGSPSGTVGIANSSTDYQTILDSTATSANTSFNLGGLPANGYILNWCPTAAPVLGNSAPVCVNQTMTLTDPTPSGTWSSSDITTASVDAGTGVVTGVAGGTATITYTASCGSVATTVVTVTALPSDPTGNAPACIASTFTLTDPDGAGTWSSSNTAVGTVDPVSGAVTTIAAGNTTITFTLTATGCMNVNTIVTVNPFPPAFTVTGNICPGANTPLADDSTGGTWASSNTALATVGSSSGIVTGVAAGTPDITYTLPTGCFIVENVTVNPSPSPISGVNFVCTGSAITLTDPTSGGTWSSSDTTLATVDSLTGMVTGVVVGMPSIMYTLTATGCMVSLPVTVSPLPVVSGGPNIAVCLGSSGTLTGSGGDVYSWSPADGLSCTTCASPMASPTVTTTYTVTATAHTYTATLIYNAAFTGGVAPTVQCSAWDAYRASLLNTYAYSGFTIRGSNNTTGITCTDPVVATAVANALNTGTGYSGSSDGQTWGVYIGCGSGCGGAAVEFNNTFSGCNCANGYNIRPNIGNSNWGGIDGPTCGASSQTMEVDFYFADGCTNTSTVTVTVNPLPQAYNITGGGSYCAGGTGVPIGLDTSNTGFIYQLYYGLTAVGAPVAGIDTAISFGLATGGGTYTVMATDTITGCSSVMNGTDTVVVIPVVVPTVSIFRSTSDTICDGTHTTFTTSITDGGATPHYIWKVNGSTAGTDSVAYDYVPSTGNRINVLLVSDHVCAIPDTVSSDTLTMTVFPNGTPTIHLAASPGDTVCETTPITINATTTFGGYTPTFTWIKNTFVVSSGASYSYTPIDGDNVYCIMNSDYMCRLADMAYSNVVTMSVEAPIVPAVTISARPGFTLTPGIPDTLMATVTSGGSAPMYQWYLNGAMVPGATSNVYIRDSFSNHDSISCMVTRNDACALATINSVVLRVYKVGIQSLAANVDLALIPNPNKGTFFIKGSLGILTDEEVSVEITNMLGQSVYKNKFMTHDGNIDQQIQAGNDLASGTYVLSLRSSAGNNVFHFVIGQ